MEIGPFLFFCVCLSEINEKIYILHFFHNQEQKLLFKYILLAACSRRLLRRWMRWHLYPALVKIEFRLKHSNTIDIWIEKKRNFVFVYYIYDVFYSHLFFVISPFIRSSVPSTVLNTSLYLQFVKSIGDSTDTINGVNSQKWNLLEFVIHLIFHIRRPHLATRLAAFSNKGPKGRAEDAVAEWESRAVA